MKRKPYYFILVEASDKVHDFLMPWHSPTAIERVVIYLSSAGETLESSPVYIHLTRWRGKERGGKKKKLTVNVYAHCLYTECTFAALITTRNANSWFLLYLYTVILLHVLFSFQVNSIYYTVIHLRIISSSFQVVRCFPVQKRLSENWVLWIFYLIFSRPAILHFNFLIGYTARSLTNGQNSLLQLLLLIWIIFP